MQCNWQIFARRLVPQRLSLRTYASTVLKDVAHYHQSSFFEFSSLNSSFHKLSPAQRGLAASQAISLALRDRNISDAYRLVNSIRFAHSEHFGVVGNLGRSVNSLRPIALAFGSNVSARLPSHTLLHGLIRMGETAQATSLAEQMMNAGMRVRCRSLEALYTSMASTPHPPSASNLTKPLTLANLRTFQSSQNALSGAAICGSSTGFALRLLALARQSRERRSRNMFKTLMALCLINGEIILASLIFGILIRDWQSRKEMVVQATSSPSPSPEAHKREVVPTAIVPRHPVPPHTIYDTPVPTWTRLADICSYIDDTLSDPSPPQSSLEHLSYQASLQALANLASMLDTQEIPFAKVNCLMGVMVRYHKRRRFCNSDSQAEQVWVPQNPNGTKEIQMDAADYFERVLKRLIGKLPTRPSQHSTLSINPHAKHSMPLSSSTSKTRTFKPATALPPLPLSSYNTLLHFCFQNLRSPHLAEQVLNHMVHIRQPKIKPDEVTMNIVHRGGRLSRDERCNDLLDAKRNLHVAPNPPTPSSATGAAVSPSSKPISTAETPSESPQVDQCPVEALISIVETDTPNDNYYALSTQLTNLIATGQPQIVVDALPQLLPGLFPDPASQPRQSRSFHSDTVQCAVLYGPIVLTCILNALMKTGRTGWAEQVWLLGLEAEKASWSLTQMDSAQEVSPWCFGVQAYTVMVRVYGKEARKGAGYGGGQKPSHRQTVRGWGYGILRRGSMRQNLRQRHVLGRHMAMRVYKLLQHMAETDVVESKVKALEKTLSLNPPSAASQLVKLKLKKNHLQIPQPDAEFFNAVLDVVGRKPGMRLRGNKRGMSRLTRLWLRRRAKWVWQGKADGCEPDIDRLRVVLVDMKRHGFGVPAFWKRLLVGRADLDLESREPENNTGRVWLKTRRRR